MEVKEEHTTTGWALEAGDGLCDCGTLELTKTLAQTSASNCVEVPTCIK